MMRQGWGQLWACHPLARHDQSPVHLRGEDVGTIVSFQKGAVRDLG